MRGPLNRWPLKIPAKKAAAIRAKGLCDEGQQGHLKLALARRWHHRYRHPGTNCSPEKGREREREREGEGGRERGRVEERESYREKERPREIEKQQICH